MPDYRGWYDKYRVYRTDGTDGNGGKHGNCLLFVLDLTHDSAAREAMRRYAQLVELERPALAADILRKLGQEEARTRSS